MLSPIGRTCISGFLAVGLMDLFVNFPAYYVFESRKAVNKEKALHKFGRWAPEAAATLIASKLFSVRISDKNSLLFGRMIHFGMGMTFSTLYFPFLRHSVFLKKSAGLPLCALLFAFDEIASYLMGFAAKPTKYPWQAHLRGLMSNTLQGLIIHQLLLHSSEVFGEESI